MITRGALVSEGPFNSHDYSESLFELNIDDSKVVLVGKRYCCSSQRAQHQRFFMIFEAF